MLKFYLMILFLYSIFGRFLQLLPKYKIINILNMKSKFYAPINNHYVNLDLRRLKSGRRELKTIKWLNQIPNNSVYFDVGTDYGQEVVLLSSLVEKNIKIYGFDCSLLPAHYCSINNEVNNNKFEFTFAAVSDQSGKIMEFTALSNLSIKSKYTYKVMTLSLDDFCKIKKIFPTHLKIDVDGGELKVIKGAENVLNNSMLREIYIEIDDYNKEEIFNILKVKGFDNIWTVPNKKNSDYLFKKIL